MRNKKKFLANFLRSWRLNLLVSHFQDLFSPGIRMLAYHRIMNYDESTFPFDLELISATPESFRDQVNFIKKHYHPITFTELAELTQKGLRPPKNAVIITFDDGFIDNYEVAYPILKEANVPATIFISTQYIGGEDTFWFDELAYAVKKVHDSDISFNFNDQEFSIPAVDQEEKHDCLISILNWIKRVPNADRLEFMKQLRTIIPIEEKSSLLSKPMSWDQIKELDANGIEIASHACTHPILSQLSYEELAQEVSDSKKKIEEMLNKPCVAISYPVGEAHAYNQAVTDAVKEAGYIFGCTYESGHNKIHSLTDSPFLLRRNHIERDTDFTLFESTLALPNVFD